MSLRVRLIVSIVIVLFLSLCVGGAAACWHATRSVRTEMQAALAVGTQTVRNGVAGVSAAGLERLVHEFDGDRHVRADLLDVSGQWRAGSVPATLAPNVPAWFVDLLAPKLPPARFDLGAAGAIRLTADPRNEAGEVWTQWQDDLVAAGLSSGLSIVLVAVVVGRALRPLDRLSAALASIGSGDHAAPVTYAGPPEVVRLARGFNAMVERLGTARARNVRLHEQLLTLQEEERADLARDLHDEIGPFLFAVSLDAASIEQAVAAGRTSDVPERARAIRDAVGRMQRQVRAMLHRLRPARPAEAGLTPALEGLVAFWRARQPAVAFSLDVSVDAARFDDATAGVIFRVVQEGLSNAVRHGRPRCIVIAIGADDSGGVILRIADDGAGLATADKPGFGVTGMRERVEGLGGTLHAGRGQGAGFVVTARLPAAAMASA
jgi:two-component system sensor histidine kinase UhpB